MKLVILQQGSVVLVEPIGASTLSLGRSSSNDIVLRAGGISGHHALVFREGSELRIRDLRSTNGTFVNDVRVAHEAVVCATDVIRLGLTIEARIVDGGPAGGPGLRLEQVDGPLAWAVDRAGFSLPGTQDASIRVGEREIWLVCEGRELARIDEDEPFEVQGLRFVLRVDPATEATVRPVSDMLPYALSVDLDRCVAELTDGDLLVTLRTSNRVSLLHVLGQAWQSEERGLGPGWVDDERLGIAVWGRAHRGNLPNNLNVLIHRVRRSVEVAGLDRWFIERRTGATRVRVSRVCLT